MNCQNMIGKLVLISLLLVSSGYSARSDISKQFFRVERVDVFAKYDSAFVLAASHGILPPDRDVTQAQVDCLLAKLRDSGLFERIDVEWSYPVKGIRRLTLRCHSKPGRKEFVVSSISLMNLPEVDLQVFLESLANKGLKPGVRLLQFPYDDMNDMIDESIRSAVPRANVGNYQGSAWVSFNETNRGRIEVKVFATAPDCQ